MIKRYFIAGLLVWVPVWMTLLVLGFIAHLLNQSLALLPENYHPDDIIGFHIPGLGIVFTLLLVFFTGVFVTNYLGNQFVNFTEGLLNRIPLVRSIYSGSKQIMHTIFKPEGQAFKKALLINFPHSQIWTVAFQTGAGLKEAEEKIGEELVSVFVPTTPNPTGGFFMLVPKSKTMPLEMSVESAFKLIISLGVISPNDLIKNNITKEKEDYDKI